MLQCTLSDVYSFVHNCYQLVCYCCVYGRMGNNLFLHVQNSEFISGQRFTICLQLLLVSLLLLVLVCYYRMGNNQLTADFVTIFYNVQNSEFISSQGIALGYLVSQNSQFVCSFASSVDQTHNRLKRTLILIRQYKTTTTTKVQGRSLLQSMKRQILQKQTMKGMQFDLLIIRLVISLLLTFAAF